MRRRRPVRPASWSLRTRLLTALVGLLAAVCLIVGVVTQFALRGYLVGQLDSSLSDAATRSAGAVGAPPDIFGEHLPSGGTDGDSEQGVGFLRAPGQPIGAIGARISGGRITAAAVRAEGDALPALSAAEAATVAAVPADRRYHTRTVGRRGQYRLLAARAPDGDVFVTGLPLSEVNATLHRLAVTELAVAAIGLLLATLTGAGIVRRNLRPLRRVAATASQVSTLQLDRGEVALAERVPATDTDPRTEVGQVGGALNRLLDHVSAALAARQASETRVRQFLADASHELRTPLASIRGYAEFTSRAGPTVPPDISYAMGRVQSEAGRMSTLVDDLLLLARLDSGRPLDRGPVDLSRLLIDAVSDASAAGPDHRWQLDLPDEPVTVTGDAARLQQVLVNLLGNARTHTPPGSTVTARLRSAAEVLLTISDDGPGIAPELLPHLFERFARADSSRSRAAGSTGLGLAIVESVVTAHGGTVEVTSQPGATAFRVRLPAATAT